MTSNEQLTAWRAEIATELDQCESQRDPLLAELADTERQVDRLKAAYAELEATVTRAVGTASNGLALPLYGRLADARQEMLHEVARIRGSLASRVKALDQTIDDRRLALAQIDRALAGERRHVPEVVGRPRPAEVSPFTLAAAGGK